MLHLKGGKAAIEFVSQSLEIGTPVVVVNGSGRIADCLAAACQLFRRRIDSDPRRRSEKPPSLPEPQIEEIVLQARVHLGFQKEKGWNEELRKCLRFCHLITVFNPQRSAEMHTSLDRAIYDAHLAKVILDMKTRIVEEPQSSSPSSTSMNSYCNEFSRLAVCVVCTQLCEPLFDQFVGPSI